MALGRDEKAPDGLRHPNDRRRNPQPQLRQSGGFIASLARGSDPQWQLANAIVEGSSDPVIVADASMGVLLSNPPFATIVGRAPHEMSECDLSEFLQADAQSLKNPEVLEQLEELGRWGGRGRLLSTDGDDVAVRIDITAVKGEHGVVSHYVVFARPEEPVDRVPSRGSVPLHDTTTGLPRWALLRRILRQKLKTCTTSGQVLAVLVLELRNVRRVSQTHGYEMGRRVRALAASRITPIVGQHNTLSRLDGDMFGIVLSPLDSPQKAVERAQELIDALRPPFEIRGEEVFVKADVGVAIHPRHSEDADELLRNAEVALE